MHCNLFCFGSGWRVEFWSFDSNGNIVDRVLTNELQSPGCSEQYGQYFQATNSIFAFVLGVQSSGCSSWSQTWTFNDASYGSTMTYPGALMESYDSTCSDFKGFGSAQFSLAIYQQGSVNGYPTFYVYNQGTPSCWSVSAGYRYATVTFTG